MSKKRDDHNTKGFLFTFTIYHQEKKSTITQAYTTNIQEVHNKIRIIC